MIFILIKKISNCSKSLNLKTLPSGPAARSAPKNFSTESEKFSGAAPPHVTRGMEGFEIYIT